MEIITTLTGNIETSSVDLTGDIDASTIDLSGNIIGTVTTDVKWGRITGDIEDQTDLDTALDKKINSDDLDPIGLYDIALLFK